MLFFLSLLELPETSEAKKLLKLFVFGSYEEYKNSTGLELTERELRKLKQVSLTRIASQSKVACFFNTQCSKMVLDFALAFSLWSLYAMWAESFFFLKQQKNEASFFSTSNFLRL